MRWTLPDRLSIPRNESVARFLDRAQPSAHSDVATELTLAADGLPGAAAYCPDPQRYAYLVLHDERGTIFGLAYGMRGLALRIGADALDEASREGAEAEAEIGRGWAVFDPFRVDERTEITRARLKRWCARSYQRARDDDGAIYHLALRSELRAGVKRGTYRPARFAEDGFVHCAERANVLVVAGDYFADVRSPLVLLAIDPARLGADVIYEAPAPIPGGGRAHLESAARFPHVYGPINLSAITGVAPLVKRDGAFVWPERWVPVREMLGRGAVR